MAGLQLWCWAEGHVLQLDVTGNHQGLKAGTQKQRFMCFDQAGMNKLIIREISMLVRGLGLRLALTRGAHW